MIVSYGKGAKFLDFVTGGKGKLKIVASDDATLHARGVRDRRDVWEARTRGMVTSWCRYADTAILTTVVQ